MSSTSSKAECLQQFVRSIDDVPTVPAVVHKILSLMEDPNSSVNDLERVIVNDPTATAKLLKLSNSAYYGFARRITTVHQAVIVIGFNAVKSIVIGLSVFDAFKNGDDRVTKILNGLWIHSLGVATLSKEIALRTRLATPETAFVCGLLHDFGKVLLMHNDSRSYIGMIAAADQRQCDLRQLEEESLGFDHADLGGWITERWQLPQDICAAARDHHLSPTIEVSAPAKIVNLANAMVQESKLGWSGYNTVQPPSTDLLLALGLGNDQLNDLRAYLAGEQEKVRVFYEVMVAA